MYKCIIWIFILNIVIIIPFGFIGLFAVYPQEGRFQIGALVIFSVLILDFLRYEPLQLFGNLILMAQLLLIIVAIVISLISIAHYLSVYSRKIRHLRIVGRILKLERLLILVNPKSGGFTNPYRRRLLRIFARRRKAEMIVLPNSKNIYSGLKHKINSYGQIIIAGGDGSFESALNNRCFKNKSLGFFPLGAGNSYYSYFYRGKRFEYLRSRFKFKELLLDVLELKFNGRKIQTTFLSLGIDAEVIKQIKQVKNHNFDATVIRAIYPIIHFTFLWLATNNTLIFISSKCSLWLAFCILFDSSKKKAISKETSTPGIDRNMGRRGLILYK